MPRVSVETITPENLNWTYLIIDEHNRKALAEKFNLGKNATWDKIAQYCMEKRQANRPMIISKSKIFHQASKKPSCIDQGRIKKAGEAFCLPETNDPKEIQNHIGMLHDAICALQSLDDLGSPEANEAAWQKMIALQKIQDQLRARLN